jgi:flagellar basal-body rod modification protein FlgD
MTTTTAPTGSTTNNSSGSTANSLISSATNSSDSTEQMFTQLLVAQIQNQDPLDPTDPTDFVNQLATLSQTESMSALSTLTSNNGSILQSLQVLALGAQVGSSVSVTGTSVTLGTTPVTGDITLANASSSTTLELTDSGGAKHDIALGTQAPGTVPFSIDPAALGLAPGTYTMSVLTSSSENPPIDVNGTLGSVRLSASGSVVLSVSNVGEVAPSAVTGFNGKNSTVASN